MRKLLLVLLLLDYSTVWAQPDRRGNVWHFGELAGLNFAGGTAQILDGSRMGETLRGIGTIGDETGQLVFYSDGQTVWNRFHRVVPGGNSLIFLGKRQGGSTQNGILLPHPKNPDWYYLFSIEQPFIDNDRYTVYYSLIDSKANGGEGGFISKLTLLARNVASSLAVVRHCNNRDFWLIVHDAMSTNTFMSYLLDEAGVTATPTLNQSGSRVDDNGPGRAYLKASPDGKRLAMGFYGSESNTNFAEVFSFDNKTGQVGQRLTRLDWPSLFELTIPSPLEGNRSPSDIAFSPNGQYLYATRRYSSYVPQSPPWRSELYQFNLATKAWTRLVTETYDFSQQGINYVYSGLENAPDGRLYVSHWNRPFLSSINNPNADGAACGFQQNTINLAGRNAGLYLPFRYPPRLPDPTVTVALQSNPTGCNDVLTSIISGFDPSEALRYQWLRDGKAITNATNATYTVLASGGYALLVEEVGGCRRKLSDSLPVTIANALLPPALTSVPPVCVGSTTPTLQATGQQVQWYTSSPPAVSVAAGPSFAPSMATNTPGTYTYYATQTDTKGCTSPANSTTVRVVARPDLTLTQQQVGVCLETLGATALLEAISRQGVQFMWSLRGQLAGNQATITVNDYGRYYISVTDQNQCVRRDSVEVIDRCYRLYMPNAFTPNDDQANDALVAYGNGISRYDLLIYNRWGEVIFAAPDQPFNDGSPLWDGRVGGSYVQPGLYTYQLRVVRQEPTDSIIKIGSVLVIR
ncbi:T9SS type B sorting domain-containing protein [Fibrella aquatilis]|uniref:Gliding motility-associated C-terminal domain-containing protein n=1 Tax=Fibrella aquatilis TaxID=2817059 RepID=A0A939JX55_9BACT|nr:gliding motility-associated C-terminal domain-containing protein [Fibrella aquatilis]MBO0932602.1 gliding motility-associated C-terminal domain-containing protein [Fibrella aquatilis]